VSDLIPDAYDGVYDRKEAVIAEMLKFRLCCCVSPSELRNT
jgi:hypothetical protein